MELATPSGSDFATLIALCRAANKQGHTDQVIDNAAVRMHWQIVWAKNFYAGKLMRRHPMKVSRGSRGRRAPYGDDVRRIRARLHKRDFLGYTRAWIEAPPYVQRLILSEIKVVARSTDPSRAQMWPHVYRALLIRSIDSLLGKDMLKAKPHQTEKDRCKLLLEHLWCCLTGEKRQSFTYLEGGILKGEMYEFMLSVSKAYEFGIVTAHSAHRLRRRKQIPDKKSLEAR